MTLSSQDILGAADGIDDIALDDRWESPPDGLEFADRFALAMYVLAGEGRFDGSYEMTGDVGTHAVRIGRFLMIVDESRAFVSTTTYASEAEAEAQAAILVPDMRASECYEDLSPKLDRARNILDNYYDRLRRAPHMSDSERRTVIDRLADVLGGTRRRV